MSTIAVQIVSTEKEIFSGEAQAVFADAEAGEVGIYPQHAPFLSTLRPGHIRLQMEDGEDKTYYVSGGILEVQPHEVVILADTALRGEDLDEALAQQAKERAEEALNTSLSDVETAKALAEIAEATAQLRLLEELRKKVRR